MKILVITVPHPETLGGVQTFSRVLKKNFDKELEFLTLKNNYKKIYDVEDIVEIPCIRSIYDRLNRFYYLNIWNFLMIKKIKKINPDICIINSLGKIRLIENINCKKILVQHISLDRIENNFLIKNNTLLKKAKNNLDYVVTLSKYDKANFIRDFNFSEDKVKVIRHGCEIELIESIKKIRNKNLIMLGRIDGNKRFDLIIKAMNKIPDFNLKIYGDGAIKKELEELIKNENINNVKIYEGTNKVQEKLDESSIFIMASDSEAYGITLIEAMRRGLGLIVRNTYTAAKDIVVNNENGILLDKKWDENLFIEAVYKIYNNYDYYSKNSLKLAKRYNLDIIKKQWENLFR